MIIGCEFVHVQLLDHGTNILPFLDGNLHDKLVDHSNIQSNLDNICIGKQFRGNNHSCNREKLGKIGTCRQCIQDDKYKLQGLNKSHVRILRIELNCHKRNVMTTRKEFPFNTEKYICLRLSQRNPCHPSWQIHSKGSLQYPCLQPGMQTHSSQVCPVLQENSFCITKWYRFSE